MPFLRLLLLLLMEERSKDRTQADQYQNARPPLSRPEEDRQADPPESAVKASPTVGMPPSMPVFSMFVHVFILVEASLIINIRSVSVEGCSQGG